MYGSVGQTSWNQNGWGGPCTYSGTHNYHFKLYAMRFSNIPVLNQVTRRLFENSYLLPGILDSTEIRGTVDGVLGDSRSPRVNLMAALTAIESYQMSLDIMRVLAILE